jgi:hypothetical protein
MVVGEIGLRPLVGEGIGAPCGGVNVWKKRLPPIRSAVSVLLAPSSCTNGLVFPETDSSPPWGSCGLGPAAGTPTGDWGLCCAEPTLGAYR